MKVSELSGAALDWLVAKCEGRTLMHNPMGKQSGHGWWVWEEVPSGKGGILIDQSCYMEVGPRLKPKPKNSGEKYSPSTDWAQGGPIIEREEIAIDYDPDVWNAAMYGEPCYLSGPTPLVAAMRCYVASKLGDGIEIPKELT